MSKPKTKMLIAVDEEDNIHTEVEGVMSTKIMGLLIFGFESQKMRILEDLNQGAEVYKAVEKQK